jgi:hypothetical protein
MQPGRVTKVIGYLAMRSRSKPKPPSREIAKQRNESRSYQRKFLIPL